MILTDESGNKYKFELIEEQQVNEKKVAFVIGHTSKDKGAYSKTLGESEWSFFSSMTNDLKSIGDVFTHNPDISSYTQRQIKMSEETNDYDLVFELHFNSLDRTDVNGCEALAYHSNTKAVSIAHNFCTLMLKNLGIRSRGVKKIQDKNERGGKFVVLQKPTAILLEPFFGSNKEDCLKFDKDIFIDVLKEIIKD